jgi:signal peptidase I
LVVLALILFSLRSSLADWNDVPSGSMLPTVLVGDRILVNKLAYDLKVPFTTLHVAEWSAPQRGEVVVFYSPHDGERLVKRVIGLPGDTVELKDNRLIVNDQPVDYASLDQAVLTHVSAADKNRQEYACEVLQGHPHAVAAIPFTMARRDFPRSVVPPGHYFMMGDNRDESFDSRYFGTVPRREIIGRAEAVVFSLDRENNWVPRWTRVFHRLDKGLGDSR